MLALIVLKDQTLFDVSYSNYGPFESPAYTYLAARRDVRERIDPW